MQIRFAILLGCLVVSNSLTAENWPRFRGPNGSGISADAIPVEWKDSNFQWKTALPATGHGSPVVWGDKIFLLCADQKNAARTVVCVSAKDGAILWKHTHAADKHKHHKQNSFASSTPAVDAGGVYFSWGTPEALTLMATSHDGAVKWKANLGPVKGGHGFGASPMIWRDSIILNNDQDGASSLLALDKLTGILKWKTPRQSKRLTYSTPCVYGIEGRNDELIFTNWHHGITGIDAETGQVKWENDVFGKPAKERAIGSPILAGDLCRLLLSLHGNVATYNQIFCAAGPDIAESRAYYQIIADILSVELQINEIPVDAHLAENPNSAPFLCHRVYDLAQLKASGAHVPATSLEEGLRQHVESLIS